MMKTKYWIALTVTLALFLAACGGAKEEAKTEAPAAAPAATAPPIDEANAATVSGKVSFTGDKPRVANISMDATPACARQHSTPQKSEEVVLNGNGTLKNVFVWVKSGLPDRQWPTPATNAALDQKTCIYNPHVLAVMVNQNIDVTNSDPTNHNIHPQPTVNREWNESQPPQGEKKVKSFPREEAVPPIAVKCNVHPWMRSYVAVVSHPFFAVTGDDGSFTIKGLPPGEYTIEAWHEKYGKQEQKIKVEAKQSATADFSYKG
jgi:hypothetical protein